ncbi:MAG TPA: hypothetical protein VG755_29950 [Nannocystaceae bacterium]|nr:hypothetical protein [Nannocystaceae bacterium]
MRTASIALTLALACTPLTLALAHGGNHGGGHGGHGHGGHGGGGGGGNAPTASVKGAGQRLAFTFGGEVKLKNGKAKGEFVVSSHPLAPPGATLGVSCHYKDFSDVTIAGDTATFTGHGKCRRLGLDGTIEKFDGHNVFQIVDRPSGDAISVTAAGSGGGLPVPAGTLEFGGFTVTPAP